MSLDEKLSVAERKILNELGDKGYSIDLVKSIILDAPINKPRQIMEMYGYVRNDLNEMILSNIDSWSNGDVNIMKELDGLSASYEKLDSAYFKIYDSIKNGDVEAYINNYKPFVEALADVSNFLIPFAPYIQNVPLRYADNQYYHMSDNRGKYMNMNQK